MAYPQHRPDARKQRTFALEIVAAVSAWPHIDKETLFAESMAFHRWLSLHTSSPADLDIYICEFAMHHAGLMRGLPVGLQEAAFITWFSENGFHKLPLLVSSPEAVEMALQTRFSSPSFRLPTDTRHDGYLIQWLFWHLSQPWDADRQVPPRATLHHWAHGLVSYLPESCDLNRDALMEACNRFFYWCRTSLDTWDPIHHALREFARCCPDLIIDYAGQTDVADAHFIRWFIERELDKVELHEWADEDAS